MNLERQLSYMVVQSQSDQEDHRYNLSMFFRHH